MTISEDFERFQYLKNTFYGKRKPLSRNWNNIFSLKALRLNTHHFHTKLPNQKPMLRLIEWWVQNEPIAKNGVLPVTTLFFWKSSFSLRTSYWCTNDWNAHIRAFCKPWSFIWRCFFSVSNLKKVFSKRPKKRSYLLAKCSNEPI